MAEMTINGGYTTSIHIQECIQIFKDHSKNDKIFNIIFSQSPIEIDILFISYLIILKSNDPDVDITIILPTEGKDASGSETDMHFKLVQYMFNAYIMTNMNIFSIQMGLQGIKKDIHFIFEEFKKKHSQNPQNESKEINYYFFVISETYLPFLFISSESADNLVRYQVLFDNPLSSANDFPGNGIFDKVTYDISNDTLYATCRDTILKKVEIDDTSLCLECLGRLAFNNILYKSKVLNIFLDNEFRLDNNKKRENLHVSRLQSSQNDFKQYDYYNQISYIFEELAQKPMLYHFVFSTILSSDLFPDEINKDNVDSTKSILISLWDYTKDLVHCLKELAKNILEHAEPGTGVITGRISKKEVFDKLKGENGLIEDIYAQYLNSLKDSDNLSFFDFNIVDLGKKGVIPTLRDKSAIYLQTIEENQDQNTARLELIEMIKEDLDSFNKDKIKFEHFFNSKLSSTLNQQTKRATAHLGLLKFSKFILENKGILFASTLNKDGVDGIIFPRMGSFNSIPYGTNYNLILPVNSSIKEITSSLLITPLEEIAALIKDIEIMFKFELLEINKNTLNVELKTDIRYLCKIQPQTTTLTDKESELQFWKEINSIIENNISYLNGHKSFYFYLDLNGMEIEENNLFRILGNWELFYPKISLIVINFSTEVLYKLKILNDDFKNQQKVDYDYWNQNSIVLFYSYCLIKDKRFYFTDALFGRTENDFKEINKCIRKTDFNAFSILEYKTEQVSDDSSSKAKHIFSVPLSSDLFLSNTTLLPFDLLLQGENHLTLFEHNASFLLQNELQI